MGLSVAASSINGGGGGDSCSFSIREEGKLWDRIGCAVYTSATSLLLSISRILGWPFLSKIGKALLPERLVLNSFVSSLSTSKRKTSLDPNGTNKPFLFDRFD